MLLDKKNNKNDDNAAELVDAEFGFPSEFPYEFDSSGLKPLSSPPMESMASLTKTKSSNEEDYYQNLSIDTRKILFIYQKKEAMVNQISEEFNVEGRRRQVAIVDGGVEVAMVDGGGGVATHGGVEVEGAGGRVV